jgi:hypothetical protein
MLAESDILQTPAVSCRMCNHEVETRDGPIKDMWDGDLQLAAVDDVVAIST